MFGCILCTGVIRREDVCELSLREGHQYVPKFRQTPKSKPEPEFCNRTSTVSGLHRIPSRPWNYQRPSPQPNWSLEPRVPSSKRGMDNLWARNWSFNLEHWSAGLQSSRVFICPSARPSSIFIKLVSRSAVAELSETEPVRLDASERSADKLRCI